MEIINGLGYMIWSIIEHSYESGADHCANISFPCHVAGQAFIRTTRLILPGL